MNLGSAHGAEVEFAEFAKGRISALRFARANLTLDIVESFDPDPPSEVPHGIEQRFQTRPNDFSGPLTETTFARQRLAGGTREITVTNHLLTTMATLAASRRQSDAIIAVDVRFVFDLPVPGRWALRCVRPGLIVESTPSSRVEIVDGAVRLSWRVTDASWGHDADGEWLLELPAGRSEVVLALEVGAWRQVSDTVVVCRQDQMREAAIVLAAIPDRRFVPLLVLEPSPMALEDVRTILREFRKGVDETLGQIGSFSEVEFARKTGPEIQEFFRNWAHRRGLQQEMHPHRSWTKRNTMLRRAIVDFGIRKAICLFEPAPADLLMGGVEYEAEKAKPRPEGEHTFPGLLDGLQRTTLQRPVAGRSLEAFFDECRVVIEGSAGLPVLEVPDDPASVILGLHRARHIAAALRIRPAAAPGHAASTRSQGTFSGDHVVAAEVSDQASSLIAPLFAAHVGAELLTLPTPDVTEAARLVGDLQQAVVDHARRVGGASESDTTTATTKGWLDQLGVAFKTYVLGDRRYDLLQQLEREVTRQVPAEFVRAVGERALTVFGSGLPYAFVKRDGVSWSNKPIGHIISDPDLLIISELHSQGSVDALVAFNAVIDSGFFHYSETDVVTEALTARSAKTMILNKDTEISTAFFAMTTHLPLDFIFFNTHGTDDAILLGDYPLQDFQIMQWYEFGRRPLVFNNSCLSWTGVGRDFVRVGARGYVGTLWSVGTRAAAELAERSMHRMISAGESVSAAIRQTDVDPFTSRAYVFVGTATASFARDESQDDEDDPVRLIAVMQNYMKMLWAMRRRADGADAFMAHLYSNFKALRDSLASRNEARVKPVLADALIAETRLLSVKDDALNASLESRLDLIERSLTAVADASFEADARNPRAADLLFLRAEIHRMTGAYDLCEADALAAIEAAGAASDTGKSAMQTRIQSAIDQGRIDDAVELLKQAELLPRSEEDEANEDRAEEMMILGRLCQALKRKSDRLDEAADLARKGLAIAHSIENYHEEATFSLDLAHVFQLQARYREAQEAAQLALASARRGESATAELAAYGTLGQCFAALGDLANARQHAQLGLARARELGEHRRAAIFLNDLAAIEVGVGDVRAATDFRIEGMRSAASSRASLDIWGAAVRASIAECTAARASDECGRAIGAAIGCLGAMRHGDGIDHIGSVLISLLTQAIADWPDDERLSLTASLLGRADTILLELEPHEKARAYAGLLFAICQVFALDAVGDVAEAQMLAQQVDQAMGADGSFITALATLSRQGR